MKKALLVAFLAFAMSAAVVRASRNCTTVTIQQPGHKTTTYRMCR